MKKQNYWKFILGASLAVALTFAIGSSAQSQSAERPTGKNMIDGDLLDRCLRVQKLKEKLNEDTAVQDSELAEQGCFNEHCGGRE